MHVLGTARTDSRVLREATTLAQAGWSVVVVDVEGDRARPREETIRGARLRHVVMPDWFVPTRFKPWFLVKAAQAFLRGTLVLLQTPADVYHAHEMEALPACFVAARLRKKPLIFDAHELPLEHPNLTRWRRLRSVAAITLRGMVHRCAGVITVSPPIAQEIQRHYGGPPPVLIRNIPAYVQPARSDRLRAYLGAGADTRIALYQGYLLADRELDRLVRAARFLDTGNMIVLMGQGAVQPMLEALIADEGVGDRVKIIPMVPYEELLQWTASADVGLVVYSPDYSPNVKMCLPNKLFEYIMAGVPVLAAHLDAVAEIIGTYGVGRVLTSLEPEAIGRSLNGLLADHDALVDMHERALTAARSDLRWERERDKLLGLYSAEFGGTGDHTGVRQTTVPAAG